MNERYLDNILNEHYKDGYDEDERLTKDKKLRETIIKNGLETAKNREWKRIEKDILDLYK